MRDTEVYRQLLRLTAPWTVTRVELNVVRQRVDVWAGHETDDRWSCPESGSIPRDRKQPDATAAQLGPGSIPGLFAFRRKIQRAVSRQHSNNNNRAYPVQNALMLKRLLGQPIRERGGQISLLPPDLSA